MPTKDRLVSRADAVAATVGRRGILDVTCVFGVDAGVPPPHDVDVDVAVATVGVAAVAARSCISCSKL